MAIDTVDCIVSGSINLFGLIKKQQRALKQHAAILRFNRKSEAHSTSSSRSSMIQGLSAGVSQLLRNDLTTESAENILCLFSAQQ